MEYEHHYQQSEKKTEKNTISHAIVPLSVHQVKSLTREGEIEHQEFQHIVLIGKIASCILEHGKYKVVLDDGSGRIELTSLGEKSKNSVIN